jgi:hypothetical protein
MKESSELGEVIASRLIKAPDGTILNVKLGRPQRGTADDWFCPVEVAGSSFDEVQNIYGVDEFQAIELAMKFIGSMLSVLNRDEYGGKLQWLDGSELGFPTALEDDTP